MRQVIQWTRSLAVGAVLAAFCEAAEPDDPIRPAVRWSGVVSDPALEARKPADGLIGNGKDFAVLWKAWRTAEEVPEIDFERYFLLVVTRPKGHTFVVHLLADDDGDARFVTGGRGPGEKELAGFGYGLAVFARDKVKSIGRKKIPAK